MFFLFFFVLVFCLLCVVCRARGLGCGGIRGGCFGVEAWRQAEVYRRAGSGLRRLWYEAGKQPWASATGLGGAPVPRVACHRALAVRSACRARKAATELNGHSSSRHPKADRGTGRAGGVCQMCNLIKASSHSMNEGYSCHSHVLQIALRAMQCIAMMVATAILHYFSCSNFTFKY